MIAKTLTARMSIALSLLALLTACKKHESQVAAAPAAGATAAPATAAATNTASSTRFDVASVPVSSAPLGDFPYVGLPDGYILNGKPIVADFDQVPFWTGDHLETVEGKVWSAGIYPDDDKGKNYSTLEVERNVEALVASLGGKKVFDGRIPADATKTINEWPGDVSVKYVDGLADIYNEPSQTFVIHRADRDIWLHLCSSMYSGGMLIAETKPLEITAKVLPASALKQQIDKDGKVALHVNFATDKTEILPDSQPQIAQVLQLLKEDPALNLSVNGHTDNSGDAAHNKTLSQGRAMAVVAMLVSQGIDPARLSAAGFGDTRPVADNASEEGKAQNRRVELVKR